MVKEPENSHDGEAIRAEMKPIGKVGYVANSTLTVIRGTMSAGRVYDRMGRACFARVMFAREGFVVVKLEPDVKEETIVVSIADDEVCWDEKCEAWEGNACQSPQDKS